MAVVASLEFGDLPAGSSSFCGKRPEDRPRWISFRDASHERGGNAGLSIGWETKSLLEATQAEITQPGAREITRRAWLQSPDIKLALTARQPPAISMLLRDFAKIGARLGRKQIQHALPIIRNKSIQENQALHLRRISLRHAADDHARVAVTYKDYRVGKLRQLECNVLDMLR